eukprot:TRINITY_DN12007_c0_g1_i2.p1 TRINITY_DN12007_c0_g1~~TRINITY_DN12007_c0_g1_i2.p1  ORF type:complete len:312 (-),score=46.22 TRINITY_DN12007_c0_g1_i2:54-989(-)
MEANLQYIARYSARDNPPPRDDTGEGNFTMDHAYGNREYAALREKIKHGDTHSQEKYLNSLCARLHKPENVIMALDSDILSALLFNLTHSSHDVRLFAMEALCLIATVPRGREEVIRNQVVSSVAKGPLRDDHDDIRLNTYLFYANVSMSRDGCHALIDSLTVNSLIKLLSSESEHMRNKEQMLVAVNNCLKLNPEHALPLRTMDIILNEIRRFFTPTLPIPASTGSDSYEIISLAENGAVLTGLSKLHIRLLGLYIEGINALGLLFEGKRQACMLGAVEVLVKLLGMLIIIWHTIEAVYTSSSFSSSSSL